MSNVVICGTLSTIPPAGNICFVNFPNSKQLFSRFCCLYSGIPSAFQSFAKLNTRELISEWSSDLVRPFFLIWADSLFWCCQLTVLGPSMLDLLMKFHGSYKQLNFASSSWVTNRWTLVCVFCCKEQNLFHWLVTNKTVLVIAVIIDNNYGNKCLIKGYLFRQMCFLLLFHWICTLMVGFFKKLNPFILMKQSKAAGRYSLFFSTIDLK